MDSALHPKYGNPLLSKPERPLPREIAIIGAGTIGPDIGYYLKSAMPAVRLILVDVIEKPLETASSADQFLLKTMTASRAATPPVM